MTARKRQDKGKKRRESDPTTIKKFIDERKLLLSTAPAVPNEPDRNVTFLPIQVTKKNEPDCDEICNDPKDNDDEITVPDEPAAKGPVRATNHLLDRIEHIA